VISSSQRPLPDNTRHSQQTNIHAPGGIRTHDVSRWAACGVFSLYTQQWYMPYRFADCLRAGSGWDWFSSVAGIRSHGVQVHTSCSSCSFIAAVTRHTYGRNYVSLYCLKYSLHWRMFLTEVENMNEIYVLWHATTANDDDGENGYSLNWILCNVRVSFLGRF
jgi:hypothetical protein